MIQKTKVFIPCELNESMWSIKDFDKKVIYVKEQEGYLFPLPTRTLSSLTKEEILSIGIGFHAKMRNAEAGNIGYLDMQYFPEEVLKLCVLGVDIFNKNSK